MALSLLILLYLNYVKEKKINMKKLTGVQKFALGMMAVSVIGFVVTDCVFKKRGAK